MKRITLLLIALFMFPVVYTVAQNPNLVGNGGFETISGFPTAQGELYRAAGWSNCNGGTTWPNGSPDLFNVNGMGTVKLPNTVAGTVAAPDGDGIAGFITSNGVVPNFREYLSYRLDAPLEPGETYILEFSLSNGTANWYGKRGSNGIGAAFTMAQPVQLIHDVLPITPQIEITSIVYHTDWRTYTFSYTATQPFQYLTIGNFRTDLTTNFTNFTGVNDIAYYFLDVVRVTKQTTLPAETLELHQIASAEEMDLTWHLPADADGDQYVLERSLDQQNFETIHDFGTVDNPDTDILFTDEDALPGLNYYYQLRALTRNGDLRMSPAIAATFGEATPYVLGEVYPNPVHDHFSLAFATTTPGHLSMTLIDAAGRIVMVDEQDLTVGQADPTYNVAAVVAAGVYQARFTFGAQTFTKKILVEKAL